MFDNEQSKIFIEKAKNDGKIDPYLQQQQEVLHKLIDTLTNVLTLKNIVQILPQISYQPNITTFWLLASQFQQKKDKKQERFLKLAKIYYQIGATVQLFEQFKKCQKMLRNLPKIVVFMDALCHIKANLMQQKNIHQTYDLCLKVLENLQNYKQEQFYEIALWILLSSKFIIKHAKRKLKLTVQSIEKNSFLNYLKLTRRMVQGQKIQLQQAIDVYQQLMIFSIQSEDNLLIYLQLELRKLFKKKQGLNVNKQLLMKSHNVSHKKLVKYINQQWNTTKNSIQLTQSTSCSSLFLKQNHSIIQYHKPVTRRKIPINHSTSFQKNKSSLRMRSLYSEKKHSFKRQGILEMRRSMLKKIKDNYNDNINQKKSFYENNKKKKCVYNCIRNTTLKEVVISNDSLVEEMNSIQQQHYAYPVITLQEIMLKFQEKKAVRANSIQFVDLNADKKSILLGKSLSFIQIYGSDIFHVKIQGVKQGNKSKLIFHVQQPPFEKYPMEFKNNQFTVTFDQLKAYVITSDLYFELFQEKISSPLQKTDVEYVEQFCKQISITPNTYQIIYLVYVIRMISCLIYWYYAPIYKLNGTVITHRKNLKIKDSLKFAIALEFLRNNNTIDSYNHLKNIRNKSGNIECFQYLSYGREILVKDIIKNEEKYYLCVINLKNKTYKSFKIQQNADPYFKNIQVDIISYQMQTGIQINCDKLSLYSVLSREQCTLILLQNIIETKIGKKYKKKLISKIYENDRNSFKYFMTDKFLQYSITVIEQQKQEDTHLKKQVKKQAQISINNRLQQFLSILKCFGDVYSCSYNFRIVSSMTKIIKFHLKYYLKIKYNFEGGIKLIIFHEKSRIRQTLIFVEKQQQSPQQDNYVKICKEFHDIIGVPIEDDQEIYRVNRIHKNIRQEYYRQDIEVISKHLVKLHKEYFYVAVGYQRDLHCWKITIYRPDTQSTYIALIPYEDIKQINTVYNSLHQIQKVQTRSSLYGTFQRSRQDIKRIYKYLWSKQIKLLFFDTDMKYLTLSNQKYLIFELYGSLQYFSAKCKMRIQLVQIQNKIFYFIYRNDADQKLIYAEVEENPYSYNLNAFADYICKDNKVKSYNDMFIRLYHRMGSSHTSQWALNVQGVNNLDNFCYFY